MRKFYSTVDNSSKLQIQSFLLRERKSKSDKELLTVVKPTIEHRNFNQLGIIPMKWYCIITLLGSLLWLPHHVRAQYMGEMNIIGAGKIYYDFKPVSAKEASDISKNLGNQKAYEYFIKVPPRKKTAVVFGGIGILSGLTYISTAGWNDVSSNPQLTRAAGAVCLGSFMAAVFIEDRSNKLAQKGVKAFNEDRMKPLPDSSVAEPLRTHQDPTLSVQDPIKTHTLSGGLMKGFVLFDGSLLSLDEAVDYAMMYKMVEVAKHLEDLRMGMSGSYLLDELLGLSLLSEISYYRKLSKAKKAVNAFNSGNSSKTETD